MQRRHEPVLLKEVMEGLVIKPDGTYIDATFGRGGHSRAILERLSSKGKLLVFDKDPEAISAAQGIGDKRMTVAHASFSKLREVVTGLGWLGAVDGILMDLGVSSPQLDDPKRGFSFSSDGALDMRMDSSKGETAAEWLKHVEEKELAQVLWEYGEERHSRRIARKIVETRAETPIKTTKQLADLVEAAVPKQFIGMHVATRSFQAIRIFINRELLDLEDVLSQVLEVLSVNGRLCVISFHSLEDRPVKQFIARACEGDAIPREIPIRDAQRTRLAKKIGGLIRPSAEEISYNPRSRSARLRIMEKIA